MASDTILPITRERVAAACMNDVNLALPVREYIESLVHSSARRDLLTAARHRHFIAPRILGGFFALGVLPVYLIARGTLGLLESAVIAWFLIPLGIAYFLSRTGHYEKAHILSSTALTLVIALIAAITGGLSSPATLWLVLVPVEAALSASRRVIIAAASFAVAAVGGIFVFGAFEPPASAVVASDGLLPLIVGASLLSALAYAALLALGIEAQARAGSHVVDHEEESYRLLAPNMTDVISRHGRGGVTLFISLAAEKMFGVSTQDLLGQGLFDRVHVSDRPAYLSALAHAAPEAETTAEFRVRRNVVGSAPRERSQYFWMEMRCRGVGHGSDPDRAGEVVAVMRDVTARKAQEQCVSDARNEAEKANAAKSRFLATMSHELRTPLNAVIGFSEMLMHENAMQLDAKRRHDYAALIHDSGQHLLSVVNLVLDMSKLETGNFVITPEPFAPAAVIRSCCDLLALKAHEAGLEVVIIMPAELPEMIGDKRALKQMLFNLLSNAIKFTDRGGRVTIEALAEGRQLAIIVTDTGVGIRDEDLPRLGDPFFQARGSYDRPYEGTGLGLSIVKGLVDLHHGRMQVESRIGEGTRITIRLPFNCESGHNDSTRVVDFNPGARYDQALCAISPDTAEPEVKKRA